MAAFTQEFDYDGNQLLFNLDVPTRSRNLAFHSQKPDPIIIERFGPNTTLAPTSPMRVGNKGMFIILGPEYFVKKQSSSKKSLQFSAVSEDSLNMAVQLAKRDMKKQKEEGATRKSLAKKKSKTMLYGRSRSPGSPSRSHTKITHSKQYKEKLQRRARRDNGKPLALLERERGWNSQTRSSQTRVRERTPPGAVRNMPATTNSPPTRDNSAALTLTGDEKIMQEIKRLRDEMDKCMQQIKEIEQISKTAPAQNKPKYAEDLEEERKRQIRAEEQTARSSRMIYMLNQQVKNIQGEIDKMNAMGIKQSRKSQILTRLAAAHRGAVRVLQNFVSHLPDYDLKQGVPRSYQELGLLLRQLSLCCAQLEVVGQNVSTENMMFMLKDMAELNQAIDQSITKPASPPRPCQVARATTTEEETGKGHRSRSPNRRPPVSSRSDLHKKEVGFIEEYDDLQEGNSAFMMEKLQGQDGHLTDRERAIKAGIQSLVQAADSAPNTARTPRPCNHGNGSGRKPRKKSPVPPLNLPQTPRTPHSPVGVSGGRSQAWESERSHSPARGRAKSPSRPSGGRSHSPADVLRARNARIRKGVLLPSELQSQRKHTDRLLLDYGEANYAEPTYSSRIKEVKPNEFNRPHSPLSTKRSGSVSPSRSSHKAAAARQVWLDRQDSKRELFDLEKERQKRQRIEDVSVRLGKSAEWVSRAEKKIKAKIEPLLSQAEVEMNADLLADMIMKDMVEDAATEIKGVRDDQMFTKDAMAMQDGPSLETMMQKLEIMEDEAGEIRRRWASIVYEDQYKHNNAGVHISDRPRSPSPIQLTRTSTKQPDPVTHIVDNHFNTEIGDDGAIMFTKSRPSSKTAAAKERLGLSHRDTDPLGDYPGILDNIAYSEHQLPPIRVCLNEDILANIEDYRDRFSSFLKKMNYQTVGRFNPWQIVDQIADEIMADTIDSVTKELWEINNEIVEHTYKTEFKNGGCSLSPENETAFA